MCVCMYPRVCISVCVCDFPSPRCNKTGLPLSYSVSPLISTFPIVMVEFPILSLIFFCYFTVIFLSSHLFWTSSDQIYIYIFFFIETKSSIATSFHHDKSCKRGRTRNDVKMQENTYLDTFSFLIDIDV